MHTGEKMIDTDFGYTLSIIGGKYKMLIIYLLYREREIRYNDLRRKLGSISHKTLSTSLKELNNDGLIIRKDYEEIPPKVGYLLSPKGETIIPIINSLCQWGKLNRE